MLSPENGHFQPSVWIINHCIFSENCNGNFWNDKGNEYHEVRFSRQNGHGTEQITERKGGLCLYKEGRKVGEICEVVTDTGAFVMQLTTEGDCPQLISQLEKTGWTKV
ncbi:hypothetical protein C4578_02275 [Candidatus Microgenomates bacterium]|jgi:hypothetical protein|nr:MAG: hypothetical protein C4578_02275 [Candidatus Microgenomates bacterium]